MGRVIEGDVSGLAVEYPGAEGAAGPGEASRRDRTRPPRWFRRIVRWGVTAVLLAVLPFIPLVRAGLPANESSLHFRQDDGFVHALDLRTVNRPEWRNLAAELAFRAMGFRTLRHVGTADHLHVSLRSPG